MRSANSLITPTFYLLLSLTLFSVVGGCGGGGGDSGGTGTAGGGKPLPNEAIVVTACTSAVDDCTQKGDGTLNSCGPFGTPTYRVINNVRSKANGNPVNIDYAVHEPTVTLKGILVIIDGGSLNMFITGDFDGGPVTGGGDRLAPLYAKQGYRVITMDRPDDFADFDVAPDTVDTLYGLYDAYRDSMLHAVDIASIVQRENVENLPVFMTGLSRGSISVAANNSLASGISMSSTLANPKAGRRPVGSSDVPVSVFKRPVHMLMHQNDSCKNTLPSFQRSLYDQIANQGVPISGDEVTGGFSDSSRPNPCDIFTAHGYMGIETCASGKVVTAFDAMMTEFETQAPGNHKPAGIDMVVSNTSTINLTANDADGDTLSFAVPYNETVLGGTVSVTTDGVASYFAPAGVIGTVDKFAFTVTDGKGGVGVGVVSINL